jgi:hypothetical protein
LGLRRAAVERRRIGSEAAGTLAARSIRRHTELTHTMALALVDELIAMRAAEPRADRTRLDPLERPAELAGQS